MAVLCGAVFIVADVRILFGLCSPPRTVKSGSATAPGEVAARLGAASFGSAVSDRAYGRDDLLWDARESGGGAGWQVLVGHFDALVVAALVLQCLGGEDGPVGVGERWLDDGAGPQAPGQHDVQL